MRTDKIICDNTVYVIFQYPFSGYLQGMRSRGTFYTQTTLKSKRTSDLVSLKVFFPCSHEGPHGGVASANEGQR